MDQSQYGHAAEHITRVNEERENPMQYCVSFSLDVYHEKLVFIS